MRRALPPLDQPGELGLNRGNLAIFGDALVLIAERHELVPAVTAYASGSLPVFRVGDSVVKLYPPQDRLDFSIESDVLERLEQAALPIPTPILTAQGRLDEWRYVVMSRLEGRPLEDVGADESSARALGRAVAALHRATETRGLTSHVPDYERWLEGQVRGCADKHREGGADEAWCAPIDDFLASHPARANQPVFLHTELGPGHVLAGDDGELTGLIDFVDVMVGDPEYDLACVAFFVLPSAALFDAFLEGYGAPPADDAMRQRMLRHLLLHRFGGLAWMLERRPPPASVTSLEELADAWFG